MLIKETKDVTHQRLATIRPFQPLVHHHSLLRNAGVYEAPGAEPPLSTGSSDQRSAFSGQRSAFSHQRSAVTRPADRCSLTAINAFAGQWRPERGRRGSRWPSAGTCSSTTSARGRLPTGARRRLRVLDGRKVPLCRPLRPRPPTTQAAVYQWVTSSSRFANAPGGARKLGWNDPPRSLATRLCIQLSPL